MRYIFSGNFPPQVKEILTKADDFKPISLLCTQLERRQFELYQNYKQEGFCDFIMVDSGAYSVFTGKANTTIDQYIDFINENQEKADIFVELDTIPGKWGKSKRPEDYIESAKSSWEDFLYMRERIDCKNKLLPVFHSGEPFSALRTTLEWKDSYGNNLDYIGISAAKDANNKHRDIYLQDVQHVIKKSSNPNVGIHLFGTTALRVLATVPCISCDSTTHIRLAAYGSIISPTFGTINVSSKGGTRCNQSNHFIYTADDKKLSKLKEELEPLKLTIEDISNSNAARCAFNIRSIIQLTETTYAYNPKNVVTKKQLLG